MAEAAASYTQLTPTYNAGFIVLAYAIAVVGAWTTIELLLRRTGGAGMWNFLLLSGAGIAFGSTATFGMHFVGNQAVLLVYPVAASPTPVPVHLSYDIGYTLLSLVVACLSMIIAFSFIGLRVGRPRRWFQPAAVYEAGEKSGEETTFQMVDGDGGDLPYSSMGSRADEDDDDGEFGVSPARVSAGGVVKILMAGLVCGGGIAAMHYVGQVSINSVPRVTNTAWVVFLSVLIGVLAVTLGLYLLFVVLRPKLDHKWYKRLGVAMILGLGTSLMHFVALLGTHYFMPSGGFAPAPASGASSKALIIALVCVVAPLCCLTLLIFAIVGQAQVTRNLAQRHRIIVAVALFDQQGLMLVQPNGLLPSAEIAPPSADEPSAATPRKSSVAVFWEAFLNKNRLSLDAMNKKLGRDDPAFIAFLRRSWSWRTTNPSVEKPPPTATSIFSTTSSSPILSRPPLTGGGTKKGVSEDRVDEAVLSFEQAALDISHRLSGAPDQPKVNGVLYDGILKTGHLQVVSKSSGDHFTVTQGQMLVLTRRIKSTTERTAFLARGYLFCEPGDAAKVTGETLAVPQMRVFDFFKDVYRFSRFGVVRRIEPARIYVGVLIVQALPGTGLQLVVDNKMHHSVPLAELGYFAQPTEQRRSAATTAIPYVVLNSVAQGAQELGGRSLAQMVDAQHASDSLQHQSLDHGFSDATLLRTQIVSSLLPLLQRTFSPELQTYLFKRLILVPTLVPLLDSPALSNSSATRESFLVCLKAVVPASVELPGRLNWCSFALFKAQAECVGQDSNRRLDKLAAATSRQSALLELSRQATSLTESSQSPTGSVLDGEEPGETARARRPVAAPTSFPPTRPVQLPAYDPDWVISLLKPSAPIQVQAWDWMDAPRKSREAGETF